jgi:uncharacterized membrane protein YeaQ/YmgE (transglycosylase-associated protein family)
MHIIYFALIGLAAGWLAGKVMKSNNPSLLVDLIVGVIGAILGGFLFDLLGLQAVGIVGHLVTALVGAMLLIFLLRKFGRRM